MKKTVYFTAVFLLLFFSNLFAKIVEAEHFHELTQYVTADTLAMFTCTAKKFGQVDGLIN